MSPARDFLRDKNGIRLQFSGINTRDPWDAMKPGKYPFAQNVRANLEGATSERPVQSTPLYTSIEGGGAFQNIRRLNDANGVVLMQQNPFILADGAFVSAGASGVEPFIPCRPTASPNPWMYIGGLMMKYGNLSGQYASNYELYKWGIAEPQTLPSIPVALVVPSGAITGAYVWYYVYRSSVTGAVSNPSAVSNGLTLSSQQAELFHLASPDPQVDVVDWYRQSTAGGVLVNPTYVGTAPVGTPFYDTLDDLTVANNPQMEFDNFEPFPSIAQPTAGTCTYDSGTNIVTVTGYTSWSGPISANILPGSAIVLTRAGSPPLATFGQLVLRPLTITPSVTMLVELSGTLTTGTYNFSMTAATLANQPMQAMWGPTDTVLEIFACGDPLRQGTLYWTKGNSPDSAPDTNQMEVCSPSERLMNGTTVAGLSMVFSTERAWLVYPNYFNALATVTGVVGQQYILIEAIADRGLYARWGICNDGGKNAYFIGKDGVYVSPGGRGSQSITDDDLYNLFPHEGSTPTDISITVGSNTYTLYAPNFAVANNLRLSFANGYLFFDYIDTHGTYRTLVYDPIAKYWVPDFYQIPVSIHADFEGQVKGVYLGCTDGTVRQFETTPGIETTSSCVLLTQCFNAGDTRAEKQFGDVWVNAVIPSTKTVNAQTVTDLFTGLVALNVLSSLGTGREPYILDIPQSSVGDVDSFVDIEMIFSWPLGSGVILYTWQPTLLDMPETAQQRPSDWDDGGEIGEKFVQGVIVEADTFNVVKQLRAQDDTGNTYFTNEGFQFNGRSVKAFSFTPPFVSHLMRLSPADSVPWKLWGAKWVFVPYPEAVLEWQTEGLSLGMKGWGHIPEINLCFISTQDLTLTLQFDYWPTITLPIPSSGGIQKKEWFLIPPNKFKVVSFGLSCPVAFRLFQADCGVKIGPWGRSGPYQVMKPFGGVTQAAALI